MAINKIIADRLYLNGGDERITVTFADGFQYVPVVTATISGSNGDSNTVVYVTTVSKTQATFEVSNGHVSGAILYHAISTK